MCLIQYYILGGVRNIMCTAWPEREAFMRRVTWRGSEMGKNVQYLIDEKVGHSYVSVREREVALLEALCLWKMSLTPEAACA